MNPVTVGNWVRKKGIQHKGRWSSEAEKAYALRLLRERVSPTDVGKLLGVSNKRVWVWAKNAGIKSSRFHSEADIAYAIRRLKGGATWNEVIREFGISKSRLAAWRRDAIRRGDF